MMRSIRAAGGTVQYELVQTVRRSMEMRATADGVRVFAPKNVKLRTVDEFVAERAGWLHETQRQLLAYRQQHECEHPVSEGAPILLEGKVRRLHLGEGRSAGQDAGSGELIVRCPAGADAREAVRACLIQRAREKIAQRLEHYIPIVGRAPERVCIREQRTRWGSCSNKGALNFNWKLIMAPSEALDYVVVHELSHLYELNHSKRFWDRVAGIMPDYAEWKKWLKENGHMLGI